MKFQTKLDIMMWKSYFDKGYGVTSYFKYLIGFYALASMKVTLTMIIGVIYGIVCFILGYWWYKYDWIIAEIEIGNKYNLFVQEVRKKLKKGKFL
jgi:hypothetical protein